MLQDIYPHIYHCEYQTRRPEDRDLMILIHGNQVLLEGESLPTVARIRAICPEVVEHAFYLFSIDEQGYFSAPAGLWKDDLAGDSRSGQSDPAGGSCSGQSDPAGGSRSGQSDPEDAACSWKSVMALREAEDDYHSFGGSVGWQLANWYDLHRYCGRCGKETIHAQHERAIICPSCGHSYYPRISPVVIIAIIDGDRILLTRYNRSGYRRHALVAGFVEIGETLEDAVRREVMEEVGLSVKNIRYVESQPWPFSSSLIAGFCAEADGDVTVHLNMDGGEELAEAVWVSRDELEIEDNNVSLTWDMIRKFKEGTLRIFM